MANSAYIAELGICFQAQHMAGTAGGDRLIQGSLKAWAGRRSEENP